MTEAATPGIVIAGAGIGGLATALALHARGLSVTLIEEAKEIRPLGVGINIQPAAIGELTALGLGEKLAATGIATREHRYLDHKGNTLWTEPRGIAAGNDFPQYSIHRGELQMMLLEAVRERLGDDAIRTNTRVRGFDQDADGVRVHLSSPVDGDSTIEASVLLGADGIHSPIRAQLHPEGSPLRKTAVRMWRGLAELPEFIDGRTMIIASDDNANRLVAYPCSRPHADQGKVLFNWVCLAADPKWDGEVQLTPGRIEDVLEHFSDWDFGWLDVPATLKSSPQVMHHIMVDRDPLETWGEGRVTLLGDSAHPMYPIGANGGTQAILDGITLARELAEAGDDIPAALQRYESVRRPATNEIVTANRKMDRSERDLAGTKGDVADELETITTDYRDVVEKSHA
ncbi:flavin-dependent oxidoreductase [Streptomyces sp. NA04227]|uniref:flavin-dependent oxidoreductase n=1 Tax=Streptomyces sp. NA04227 TaxID=2742136 RepID=UPI001162D820|nr:flavin-dependent oxidoreductase [Streptomyces sp. NA04227]QDJ94215.1 SpzS [Streptomyces sp.]QKW08098.1 flavin-dependent oxidoreductase [Streptomyces sp. NA04227]